jgi:hypothetical protein
MIMVNQWGNQGQTTVPRNRKLVTGSQARPLPTSAPRPGLAETSPDKYR